MASTDDSPVFNIQQTDLMVPAVTIAGMVDGTANRGEDLSPRRYPLGAVPFWSLLHAWSLYGDLARFDDLATHGT